MRKNTKINTSSIQEQQKTAAVQGAALFSLLQVVSAVAFIALCLIPDLPRWAMVLFAVLAVICVIPIGIALVVLKQRFQEIQGGELDAARQY